MEVAEETKTTSFSRRIVKPDVTTQVKNFKISSIYDMKYIIFVSQITI
jgi:hypothetical protein